MIKLKSQYSYSLFFLFLFFWAGCAPTFQYNGLSYTNSYQALNAQKIDLQNALDSITPRQNNFEGTAKVILPATSIIRKHGIVSGLLTSPPMIEYLIMASRASFKNYFDAIKKRNIFKSVTLEERDNTIDPELNDETYLIWLEVKSLDSWKWYIKSNRTKKTKIPVDSTLIKAREATTSFLNLIETTLRTKFANTKVTTTSELKPPRLSLSAKEQDIEFYKRKILSDPSNYMAHFNLAKAYVDNDQTEKAIYEYEKAIIINPRDSLAYMGLGALYAKPMEAREKYKDIFDPTRREALVAQAIGNVMAQLSGTGGLIEQQ